MGKEPVPDAWEQRCIEQERWFGMAAAVVGVVSQPLWLWLDHFVEPEHTVRCAVSRGLVAFACLVYLTPLVPTGTLRQVRVTTLATWAIAALFVGVTVPGAGDAYAMYVVSYSLLPWAAAVSLSLPLPWAVSLMAIVLSGFALPHALLGGPPVADAVAGQVYMVTAAALGATSITLRHRALRTAFLTDRELQRSEREVAASQLALIEQQALHDARNHFLERMSHELRTPLNAILGYTEMVREECVDAGMDASVEDLDRVAASGNTLLALIADILDLTALETGNVRFVIEDVDLEALLRSCVAEVAPAAARKGLPITVEAGDLGTVACDPTRVRQALLALLTNAVKFTATGNIVVRAARRDPGATIDVEDTGPGVPQDLAERIFESFVQADSRTTRQAAGAGVGLTVAREMVRRMGGEVSYRPRDGGGSTFCLEIR
ncbi:MAG: HAMP domain-containing histidine kinase [Alphaproteobacteria bacterium]|nr:HAMP domain-containing histidine kinase [Alphaproteobacteria bacterium]